MKEIGGYLELDNYSMPIIHKNAIALNLGRNCLAYIIKTKNIRKIYVPKFLCSSVSDVCLNNNTEVSFYNIDISFLPTDLIVCENEWVYVVNYYGQLNNDKLDLLKRKYENIIVDNVQAYFQKPLPDTDTIYTCRKFFGVPDGAFLYTDRKYEKQLETDLSIDRMTCILGRYEANASEYYNNYTNNEELYNELPMRYMSKLTTNLLHAIDYDFVKQRRTDNFAFLHERFKGINKLDLIVPEGAFMYPLYIENGAEIRKKLQAEKIYIPTLWPDVFELCDENDSEYDMAKNILPLPVDQRYDLEDMKYVTGTIEALI